MAEVSVLSALSAAKNITTKILIPISLTTDSDDVTHFMQTNTRMNKYFSYSAAQLLTVCVHDFGFTSK